METALGFAIPDEGTVRLFGEHASALRDESLKHRIGFVPQQDELIGALDGDTFLNMTGGFYRHLNRDLLLRLTREWAVPLFRKVDEMSGGQRQKLSILAAIGHQPELLLLDEPVSSLDPVARRAFLRELIDIVSSGQRTVVFSTYLVSDVERVANRVWIVRDGRLIVDETLDKLKESEVCRSATESFAPSGRRVECEVIAESGLALAVVGVLAVLIWLVFDIGWLVLLGYCAACTAMSVFSAYLVLWLRAEGSGLQAVTWIIMVVLMIGMALLTYSSRIGLIEPSAWLAAAMMLCMVAVLFRQLARSAYLTIDWRVGET